MIAVIRAETVKRRGSWRVKKHWLLTLWAVYEDSSVPITFYCSHCQKMLRAPESAAGKTSPCPRCGNMAKCPELVYEAEVVLISPGKPPAAQQPPKVPVAKIVSQPPPAVPVAKIVKQSPPPVPVAKIVPQPPPVVPVAKIVPQSPPSVPVARLVSTVDEPIRGLDDDDDRPYALADPPRGGAGESPIESRRPCPACGERILSSAAMCRFCGEVFDPALKKKGRAPKQKPKKASSQTAAADGRALVGGFICFVIGVGLSVVSYTSAASQEGGGTYLVFTGLIIGGLAGMARGMAGLARSGR
jgi:predicted RNA-binding Zn-ribbon protein involved in translation (DUF1610 family)